MYRYAWLSHIKDILVAATYIYNSIDFLHVTYVYVSYYRKCLRQCGQVPFVCLRKKIVQPCLVSWISCFSFPNSHWRLFKLAFNYFEISFLPYLLFLPVLCPASREAAISMDSVFNLQLHGIIVLPFICQSNLECY